MVWFEYCSAIVTRLPKPAEQRRQTAMTVNEKISTLIKGQTL